MRTVIITFLTCAGLYAQAWSGILDTSRATDWTGAGVVGGIPSATWTQCGSTIAAYTGTASTITTAIGACGSNQYVKLGAGTFNLSGGIDFGGVSNVVLRGSGSNSTFLVFTGDTACLGQFSLVCVTGNGLGYYGPGPPTHIVDWTAGYSPGTTVVTISATTGLSVGMYILLDACNSGFSGASCSTGSVSIPPTDMLICQTITTCTSESGGSTPQRPARAQRELFKVTNISGTNVTLDHGIRFPNWTALSTPQAWWGSSTSYAKNDGIEDVSIDGLNAGAGAANVAFIFAGNSWIRGIRSIWGPGPRAHVLMYQTVHCTVQDSYFFGSVSEAAGPTHYGIEEFPGYDDLLLNNIFQRRAGPFVMDGAVGTVIAYNFSINDLYSVSPTFMQAAYYSHEGGNGYNLFEGNIGPGFKADIVHASSNMATSFRGYYRGWEPGKTAETFTFGLYAFSRFYNAIGNVLGTTGYHTTYTSATPSCSASLSIFMLGCGGPVADNYVATSVMRWGNYDTVNAANRFVSGEVPSGIALYSNAVPASNTLPNSFWVSSKPAWFGSNAWPTIGPDVTSGNVGQCNGGTYDQSAALTSGQCTGGSLTANLAGGHVNANPAMACYLNVMGGPPDGNLSSPLTFDPTLCYIATSGGSPAGAVCSGARCSVFH